MIQVWYWDDRDCQVHSAQFREYDRFIEWYRSIPRSIHVGSVYGA